MQTFLPLPDFKATAKCLDWRRLGKQRVEAKQILDILMGIRRGGGWRSHPAVKMWAGHEPALANYLQAMISEWVERGYNNTMAAPIFAEAATPPPWLGDRGFHASHRSNLLRKDPEHYGKFGWTEAPDLPYVWPVTSDPRAAAAR